MLSLNRAVYLLPYGLGLLSGSLDEEGPQVGQVGLTGIVRLPAGSPGNESPANETFRAQARETDGIRVVFESRQRLEGAQFAQVPRHRIPVRRERRLKSVEMIVRVTRHLMRSG